MTTADEHEAVPADAQINLKPEPPAAPVQHSPVRSLLARLLARLRPPS